MRKKAFILVVGIIIAAGALFTAVYDVLYRYNSSNTINLNAATVDMTGQTSWIVEGTKNNGVEKTTLSFDAGTYMVVFGGQDGQQDGSSIKGESAVCIAFYKADNGKDYGVNNMTVTIGIGGGKGSVSSHDGGGRTEVRTNFALPGQYRGEYIAIAAGAGSIRGTSGNNDYPAWSMCKRMDGTFAGWSGDTPEEVAKNMGIANYYGRPATQHDNGFAHWGERTPNALDDNGVGGGGGYYAGGADKGYGNVAGGGSCTPWCYPIGTSDLQNTYGADNPENIIELVGMGNDNGEVRFFKLDPNVFFANDSYTVAYGETVTLSVDDFTNGWLPKSIVQGLHARTVNSDCGIRVGWVYSVSEDGKSWQGVGPDKN